MLAIYMFVNNIIQNITRKYITKKYIHKKYLHKKYICERFLSRHKTVARRICTLIHEIMNIFQQSLPYVKTSRLA